MDESRDYLTDLPTLARATDVFFAKQGAIRVVLHSSGGRDVTTRKLVSGDSFGELPFVDDPPTHRELANRIGATRDAMSREMLALASRRIVLPHRRRLEFLDVWGPVRLVRQHVTDDGEVE